MKKVHAFFLGLLALLIVLYVSGTVVLKQEAQKTAALLAEQVNAQTQGNVQLTYQDISVAPFGLFTKTMEVQGLAIHIQSLPMLTITVPTLKVNLGAHGFFEGTSALHIRARNIIATVNLPHFKPAPTLAMAGLDVNITPNGTAIPSTQLNITDLQFANLNEVLQSALHNTYPGAFQNQAHSPIYQGLSAFITQLDLNHVGLDVALNFETMAQPISVQYTLYQTPSFLATADMTLQPNVNKASDHPNLWNVLMNATVIHSQATTSLEAHFSQSDLTALHLRSLLAQLGYSSLRFKANASSEYDVAGGVNQVSGDFTWAKAGQINFMLHESDMPAPSFQKTLNFFSALNAQDPSDVIDSLPETQADQNTLLHQFDLSYTDLGLIPRVLSFAAKLQGVSPQALQATLSAGAQMLEAQYQGQGLPSIATALQTMQGFLQDPHTITLELAPNPPITQGEIESTLKNLSATENTDNQNALKDNTTEGAQQTAEQLNATLYNQGLEALLTRLSFSVTVSS